MFSAWATQHSRNGVHRQGVWRFRARIVARSISSHGIINATQPFRTQPRVYPGQNVLSTNLLGYELNGKHCCMPCFGGPHLEESEVAATGRSGVVDWCVGCRILSSVCHNGRSKESGAEATSPDPVHRGCHKTTKMGDTRVLRLTAKPCRRKTTPARPHHMDSRTLRFFVQAGRPQLFNLDLARPRGSARSCDNGREGSVSWTAPLTLHEVQRHLCPMVGHPRLAEQLAVLLWPGQGDASPAPFGTL